MKIFHMREIEGEFTLNLFQQERMNKESE